jgi:hypothetical protein
LLEVPFCTYVYVCLNVEYQGRNHTRLIWSVDKTPMAAPLTSPLIEPLHIEVVSRSTLFFILDRSLLRYVPRREVSTWER